MRCKTLAGRVHLLGGAQGLDEKRIHTTFQIRLCAVEGGVDALHGQRVGAGQDQRVGAGARVQRGLELAAHLGHGHHGFAVQVPATLGKALVLNLDHGGACALKAAHGALGVECVAKARVGVADDGRAHALGDAGQGVFHLGVGGQAHVGAAQPRVGNGSARQVQRLKARLLRHQGAQGVVHAGARMARGS